ncbi:MAG TPA: hypothetical protein VHO69_12285, partial [Phototrophicaceae bacterium]|nr:hypothetical protein [Phototrophicaceae bacterium]
MKYPRLFVTLLCLLFALPVLPLHAQDTPETWPLETRCVGEPTEPPEGWTFPGVILATGWAGLHGISADLPTPYIVQFIDFSHMGVGELSPDGRWWAVIEETDNSAQFREAAPIQVQVHAIIVYSTVDPDSFYRIPWEASYVIEPIMGSGRHWFEQQVRWWDNEHLIYVQEGSQGVWEETSKLVLINPFTGQVDLPPKPWQQQTHILLPSNLYALSPDHTRLVFQPMIDPAYTLINLENSQVLNPDREQLTNWWWGVPVWKPDSSQFLNHIKLEDNYATLLNSREGETVDTVSIGSKDFFLRYPDKNAWSPDGRYFVFAAPNTRQKRLYLADTHT